MTSCGEPEIDARILRALGHPVRQEVLTVLGEAPSSAATLSEALQLPLATVREHLTELLSSDAVEAVDDAETAADDRRYRATIRPFLDDAHWRQLSGEQRAALFQLTLRDISRRIEEASAAGGFGHPQTHVSLTRLELDEQGWQEITDLLAGVVEEALQIEAESAGRRARDEPGEFVGTNLAVLHFGRPERAPPGKRSQPLP
jgi:DNA-binding transcriptional ArsR family regulator